jgi:hypothetical protein
MSLKNKFSAYKVIVDKDKNFIKNGTIFHNFKILILAFKTSFCIKVGDI